MTETTSPQRLPRIIVTGEFSAGKTKLINGLVGQQVLPSNVTSTSLPPVWLIYGNDVSFRIDLDGIVHEVTGIGEVDVHDTLVYVTAVQSDALKHMDIIDTPGNSDPNIPSVCWERMIGHADMMIWCTGATQAWRQSEKSTVRDLPQALRDQGMLLITQADRVPDERQREKLKRRVARDASQFLSEIQMASLIDEDQVATLRAHIIEMADTASNRPGELLYAVEQARCEMPETEAESVAEAVVDTPVEAVDTVDEAAAAPADDLSILSALDAVIGDQADLEEVLAEAAEEPADAQMAARARANAVTRILTADELDDVPAAVEETAAPAEDDVDANADADIVTRILTDDEMDEAAAPAEEVLAEEDFAAADEATDDVVTGILSDEESDEVAAELDADPVAAEAVADEGDLAAETDAAEEQSAIENIAAVLAAASGEDLFDDDEGEVTEAAFDEADTQAEADDHDLEEDASASDMGSLEELVAPEAVAAAEDETETEDDGEAEDEDGANVFADFGDPEATDTNRKVGLELLQVVSKFDKKRSVKRKRSPQMTSLVEALGDQVDLGDVEEEAQKAEAAEADAQAAPTPEPQPAPEIATSRVLWDMLVADRKDKEACVEDFIACVDQLFMPEGVKPDDANVIAAMKSAAERVLSSELGSDASVQTPATSTGG